MIVGGICTRKWNTYLESISGCMAQWQQSSGCQNDPPDGQFQCYTIYKMSGQVDAEVPKLPLELVPDAWVVSEQLQQAAQKDFGAIKTWVNGQYFFGKVTSPFT